MNNYPTHFLYFNNLEENWSKATYDELRLMNDDLLYIIPVYVDNSQGAQCSWGEYREKELANKQPIYEYAVVEHTKYKDFPSEYDTDGLRDKLNSLARKGFRLVSTTTLMTRTASSLQGIVAIMERPRK